MKLRDFCQEIREWQPIKSAPLDGTPVLLYGQGLVEIWAYFDDGSLTFSGAPMGANWHTAIVLSELTAVTKGGKPCDFPKIFLCQGSEATHWMPLPSPPEQNETGT